MHKSTQRGRNQSQPVIAKPAILGQGSMSDETAGRDPVGFTSCVTDMGSERIHIAPDITSDATGKGDGISTLWAVFVCCTLVSFQ